MRGCVLTMILVFSAGNARGEADDRGVTFEAASIKPIAEGQPVQMMGCMGGPGSDDPGRITCEYATVKMLLMLAYQVKSQQIFGPAVLETAHYNIVAKVPQGATREQVSMMMQSLLADRFQVVMHRESRMVPVYAITVSKSGLKIKEPAPLSGAPADEPPPGQPVTGKDGFTVLRPSATRGGAITLFRNGQAKLQGGELTMTKLAESLTYQLDRIVVDETGLTGKYDVTLYWTPEVGEAGARRPGFGGDNASDPGTEPNVFRAAEQQLGLRLVSKKVAREAVVVDRLAKTPTEN